MNMPKTLFEDLLDDEFLRLIDPNKPISLGEKQAEGAFVICSPGSAQQHFSYFFELYGSIIVCRKEKGKEEIAYMDVLNTLMRKTKDTMIKGVPHYGIRFVKKRTYEEILSPDSGLVDQWFEQLKRYCLLTKFRLYFDSKQVLGKGNFAKVFLVVKRDTGQELAVKAFAKTAIMADQLEIKCLQYEIKMLRSVNHERVIRLVELYEGENFIYCVVELFKGPDLLNAIIKKGAQPEAKALAIIMQILQGLEYMHSLSIIHRDLKPENIIFKQATEAIDIGIVDLGFATFEADYRKLFVRCGTPGYVAPEVLNDKPYNCKADIFSAGVIFYMM